jgi:surfactin synthase thioesterase subunit
MTAAATRPAPAARDQDAPDQDAPDQGAAGALTLLCFHHAGGNAAVFRPWRTALPPGVRLRPVELPRRRSSGGTPADDLTALVARLDDLLDAELHTPYAVFGHSMGALLGYRLVQLRMARGATLPEAFFAAAYAAPHLARPVLGGDTLDTVDDLQLAHRLAAIGGMPRELLGRPEWLRVLLGSVREDLRLCAGHRPADAPRLPMPVHVFAGRHDPLVTPGQIHAWRRHAAGPFRWQVLDGGHFLVQEHAAGLLPALAARLHRTAARRLQPSA